MRKHNRFFRPINGSHGHRIIYLTDIYPACIAFLRLADVDLIELIPLPGHLGEIFFLYIPTILWIAPVWDLKDKAFPKDRAAGEAQPGDEEDLRRYRESLFFRVALLAGICLMLLWIKATGVARF